MKSVFFTMALLVASSSQAAAELVMKCVVNNEKSEVTLLVGVEKSDSKENILLQLTDIDGKNYVLDSQANAGETAAMIKEGNLSLLVFGENAKNVNGVLVDSGVLAVSKNDNYFYGYLTARGNFYSLVCVSK